MRKVLLGLFAGFISVQVSLEAQVPDITRAYNYSLSDALERGLRSIRGTAVGEDIDRDGRKEIAVTNYSSNGVVHVFEVSGEDSLKLVWTSPELTVGGGSTPRFVLFADLDDDGKGEVIYQVSDQGVLIFEWDGVVGSDNYGTSPSQQIGVGSFSGLTGYTEFLDVSDVDNDGKPELLIAYNASLAADDRYYIVSAIGDWSTNNGGFSSFTVEYQGERNSLADFGLSTGSPWMMISAELDGTAPREIIVHNWNNKNVVPVRSTGADTYVLPDPAGGKQAFELGLGLDDVALMGGVAMDVDGDGRDEVYLPTYPNVAGGLHGGWLHMLSWNTGEPVSEIDTTNVTVIDLSPLTGSVDQFGIGFGDIDKDGRPNLYVGGAYPYNVVTAEFIGGDKRDPSNWDISVLYAGEPSVYSSLVVRDSAGVTDTAYTTNTAFVSKLYAQNTDLDGDGKEDIVLPYQSIEDSITVTTLTWNATDQDFDTTTTMVVNPRRWSLRVLEAPLITGVEVHDWTVVTPDQYALEQNYPNPFNPSTTVRFTLPVAERVSLRVYDVSGRLVRTLIEGAYPAGTAEIMWDGRSDGGAVVASGVYFCTLSWGNFSKTVRMTLLK